MNQLIHLPILHQKQADIKASTAKRKVLVTGRRFGKTTYVADEAVDGLLDGKRVLYAAPKETQTEAFWNYCKLWLAPLIPNVIYKNETLHLLEMKNGGAIRAKTGFDADTLRGDYADKLILDEYSYMDPDLWDEVGAPMLLDNDGDAIFIFSPARKNHAFRMYLRAQQRMQDGDPRWAAWHGTSLDNPHLSQEALAELTEDMTDAAYRQEILAEFLDNEGAVFRNIDACMYHPTDEQIRAHKQHRLVAGLDWGRQNDCTVISIGCADCREEIVLDRFTQISYPVQRDRVRAHYKRWHPTLLAEANSIGEPNIEQLREDGVSVEAFNTSNQSKNQIIQNLALALEKGTWKFLDNPVAKGELEAYEQKVTRLGNMTYSAPEGLKDDTVIGRALMVHKADTASFGFAVAEGSDDD